MRAAGSMATFALDARLHRLQIGSRLYIRRLASKAMGDGLVILQDAEHCDRARRMLRVAERGGQTVQARVVRQLALKILTIEPANWCDTLRAGAERPLDLVHREFA